MESRAHARHHRTGCGSAWVASAADPDVLSGTPPDRLALDQSRRNSKLRWLIRASDSLEQKWCIVDFPTDGWAAQAYPDLELDEAHRRLFADLCSFVRAGPDDSDGAWARHAETIAQRAIALDERRLRSIR